jgi:hypothetical protein
MNRSPPRQAEVAIATDRRVSPIIYRVFVNGRRVSQSMIWPYPPELRLKSVKRIEADLDRVEGGRNMG